jgi:hypothetical protein
MWAGLARPNLHTWLSFFPYPFDFLFFLNKAKDVLFVVTHDALFSCPDSNH